MKLKTLRIQIVNMFNIKWNMPTTVSMITLQKLLRSQWTFGKLKLRKKLTK